MSAVSLVKAPSFEQVQPPKPKNAVPSSAQEMVQTIKAINVLVLAKPFAPLKVPESRPAGEAKRSPDQSRDNVLEEDPFFAIPEEVLLSKDTSLSREAFQTLFTSQDIVFIPNASFDTRRLLQYQLPKLKFFLYFDFWRGESPLIALNPKTWQRLIKRIEITAEGFTILATQKDGRQVLLSCGQFKDEKAFAKHVHEVHKKQQSINKEADLSQGWTEAIAAFDTPISRKQVLSSLVSWQWSSKIPSTDDVAIAKNILGSSCFLDENPQCAEGLIQRQITWASDADDQDVYS